MYCFVKICSAQECQMNPLWYLTKAFVFTSISVLEKGTHTVEWEIWKGSEDVEGIAWKKKLFWFRFFNKINKCWQSIRSCWLSVEVLNEFLMTAEKTWWLNYYKILCSCINWLLGFKCMKQWNISSQCINLKLFVLALKY